MQRKRNLINGLVIVSRWQFLMLRMHRFLWLLPALAAACVALAAGWQMLPAVASWNTLAAFLWLWCGVVAIGCARHCVGRCFTA
ncbi:hypothetical protein [Pseudovibrio brasiliensis]|uniref:Uncharacterized protein n=1 Tax=Pseudovibrio brasiliensis TaxID=1898042 RepID=A0ABX8AHM1_9HYPH|nr:hypothetical protein [Pseudovibrio brasiliensis]QUS54514.1 hypothetical protein KGB56_14050 [Pseudovibrio brasiliensis]